MIRAMSMLAALTAAVVTFPAAAEASFCGLAGRSAQEVAANVLKSKEFMKIGGNTRFVGYWNKKSFQMLAVTKPGNKAHPAVACRYVSRRGGDWQAWTTIKCQASGRACSALLEEFKVLDAQRNRAAQEANSKP